jgi:hypothetical protein
MPVTEVDALSNPEEYAAHGGLTGILINGRPLQHDLLRRDKLDEELSRLKT